jgi:hypothetical protein
MDTITPDQIAAHVLGYCDAWNAKDDGLRAALLSRSFSENGTYLDPHAGFKSGLGEMNALIRQFRDRFPHQLEPQGKCDVHHNVFRQSWRLHDPESGTLSQGLFVGAVDGEAKILGLWVFLDS